VADTQERRGPGMTLRGFLSVLLRRKWIVIVIVAIAAVLAGRIALRAKPIYESYEKLLVSRGQQTTAFNANVKLLSWEEELTSELEVVRSAAIYQRAQSLIGEWGVTDPSGEVHRIDPTRIQAVVPGKSSVIEIVYRSPYRTVTDRVVKALGDAYKEFRTTTREQDPTAFLNQEIDDLETRIEQWERRRADYLSQVGSVELPQERAQLLSAERSLETDLAVARSDVAEREARVRWLQDLMHDEGRGGLAAYAFGDPYEKGESVVITLRKMILQVKSEYFAARGQYTDSHPQVLALKDRLDELEKTLTDEAAAYLDFLSAQVQAGWAKVASLQTSLDYIGDELTSFPDREAQLSRLDRMLTSLRETHAALVGRRADVLTTRLGSNLVDVVVLEEAVPPYAVRTVDSIRLAVIPIFALLVAIGLAFLADSLDHTFREREELEAQLRLPVLGEVRRFK
jgi:uncharacterized protein involved in exopolysaccharide biosynthesis